MGLLGIAVDVSTMRLKKHIGYQMLLLFPAASHLVLLHPLMVL